MTDADLESRFQDAISLRDAGELHRSKDALERLAQEHPAEFGVWLSLGGVQMSLADYAGAEKSFECAISLRPRSELASLSMFHTLKHLGRLNDAFAEMRRFLAL